MKESLLVFINGTLGVFVGMGLVYALIRVIAAAVTRITAGRSDA